MEVSMTETGVLMCGAGAAGLTLAIDLARRGVSFRLIDRIEAPFHGSRGKGLQPRTLEVFDDLGIVDRIAAAGGPYPPLRTWREDGSSLDGASLEARPPTPSEPYGAPLMVPQAATERVMR
jgi:2-polyprenyl-6-methoxyphenol hydroxylase-like FAD-dependent oxidoreductase